MFQRPVMAMSMPMLLATAGDIPHSGPHAAESDRPPYLALAPIEVPIFDNGRIDGRVLVKLVVEGKDGDVTRTLADDLPKVRAGLLATLIEFNRLNVSGLSPIDAEHLSETLNSKSALPGPGVRRVLITELSSIPL